MLFVWDDLPVKICVYLNFEKILKLPIKSPSLPLKRVSVYTHTFALASCLLDTIRLPLLIHLECSFKEHSKKSTKQISLNELIFCVRPDVC